MLRYVQAQPTQAKVTIRRARAEDSAACGPICYRAFFEINAKHGFPPDFPEPSVGIGLLSSMFSHPGFFSCGCETERPHRRQQLHGRIR